MSLKLTLTQQALLQDLEPLNANSGTIGTGFDDMNTIIEENFPVYSSGKNTLDAGESILIEPSLFVTRFLMIESRLRLDVELTQPAYVRDSTSFPLSVTTQTSVARLFIQFGVYSKIVITSADNSNDVKYFVLGQKILNL